MHHRRPAPIPYEELPLGSLRGDRIEALWCYRSAIARRQLVLPDGRMDLVARGTLGPSGQLADIRLAIAGPADRPGCVNTPAATVTLGVRFRIGWGSACFGLEAAALRNQVVAGRAAQALIGPAAQAMLRARSLDELQQALVDTARSMSTRAAPPAGHARVLQAVELMRDGVSIGALGARIGTAERTLRRDVDAAVGLPLRTLAGILRFQRALSRLQGGAVRHLGSLAVEAGYSDQAHMTRAFRRFGNFTPALPEPAPVVEPVDRRVAWP